MIVRFDLEGDVVLVVEADDARVVLENADAPIVEASIAPRLANLLRGSEDRFFEHVVEAPLPLRAAIGDSAGERLVAAMLAPGLGNRFQLGVGGIAAQFAKVRLNRPHFDQRQIELPFAAQAEERLVVHVAKRHRDELNLIRRTEFEPVEICSGPTITCSIASFASTLVSNWRNRSSGNWPSQYFRSVRTASARRPKS